MDRPPSNDGQALSAGAPLDATLDMAVHGSAVAAGLLAAAEHLQLAAALKDAASLKYTHVSTLLARWLGLAPEQMLGHTDADCLDAAVAQPLRLADQAALGREGLISADHRFELAHGRREFSVTRRVLPAPAQGGAAQLLTLWSDRTLVRQQETQLRGALQQLEALQQANEKMRRETADLPSRDDALGLYQRAHFDDQLRREVDLSAREHRQFSLVSIVLDPLTGPAQVAGAAGRARVLEALGRLLRSNTRAMDASCQIDEHRFAVLLSGVGLATAHSRMEGLRRQCATQIVVLDGADLAFSVSMGVASFPHTASSQQELREAADTALDEALRRGGNQVALAGIRFEST